MGIIGLFPLCFLQPSVAQETVPNIPIPDVPISTPELASVNIAVLDSDSQSFAPLQGLIGQVVPIDEVYNSDIDALLISSATLSAATEDEILKQKLQSIVLGGKILVVPEVTNAQVKESLDLENMPTVETDDPILYSTVMELSTGTTVAGLVIGSSNTPELGIEEDLSKILRGNIAYLNGLRSEQSRTKAWERRQAINVDYPACPYGRFQETAYGEQFLGDGSSANDYFNVRHVQFSSGGTLYCGSRYQTDTLYSGASVYHGYNSITDYGPTTTNAGVTTSVTLGYGAFEKSWSFQTPDVSISDRGNTPETAAWYFNYRGGSDAAKYRYRSDPGIFVQTPQGVSLTVNREIIMRFIGGTFDGLPAGNITKAYRVNFTNYN